VSDARSQTPPSASGREAAADAFPATRWTVVAAAGRATTAEAGRALEELCRDYWFPIYAYIRRRGHPPADAEDLTQGFFERLIRLGSLAGVDRERGPFRAFLLASAKHYLADEWDRATAAKRDVTRTVPIDAGDAEARYAREPVDRLTPDRVYERQWARTLLERVLERLRAEHERAGRGELFLALRFAITAGEAAVPLAEVAARLGLSEEAVRVAAHRLRRRYRDRLREAVADTAADPSEVDAELAHLLRVFGD
jgi:RNA polymerase sigma-70 factor (ECF subfamily)